MKLHEVINHLRTLADERLAEPWDKVGLHLGDENWPVTRGLLCIDLTEHVLAEAVRSRANLIIAYHPPIFSPLERLTTADWKQRILLEAARQRIAIYSPHTALDAAIDGVNDWLAVGIGLSDVRAIRPTDASGAATQFKLVTFAPESDIEKLRNALTNAGAGRIGHYSHCSFTIPGTGTFLGDKSTNPTVGKRGRLETVDELRLEMVVPKGALADVIAALHEAHSYEEPAFDIYPLHPPGSVSATCTGQGRVGVFAKTITLSTLAARLKKLLGVKHLQVTDLPAAHRVRTVALCAGAGSSLLDEADDVDAFITGEMRHHDILAARERGIACLLPGHTQTERPYLPVYRTRLARLTGNRVKWAVSKADKPASSIR